MVKAVYRIDSNNHVQAVLKVLKDNNGSITANVETPYSWEADGTPSESYFFATVYFKSGGCSHFMFNGEGFDVEQDGFDTKEEIRPYYHICAAGCYVTHMATMAFIHKAMDELIEGSSDHDGKYKKNMKEKMYAFIDDYTIKHLEIEKEEWEQ